MWSPWPPSTDADIYLYAYVFFYQCAGGFDSEGPEELVQVRDGVLLGCDCHGPELSQYSTHHAACGWEEGSRYTNIYSNPTLLYSNYYSMNSCTFPAYSFIRREFDSFFIN